MIVLLFQYCWWNLESCGCLSDILPMSSIHGSNLLIFYLMFLQAYNVFGSNPISNSPHSYFSSIFMFLLYLFLSLIFKFNVHWNQCCLCVQILFCDILSSSCSAWPWTHSGPEQTLTVAPSYLSILNSRDYIPVPPDFYHFSWCVKHEEIKKYINRIDKKNHILWLILNPIGTCFHCFRIWYYTSLDFLYF